MNRNPDGDHVPRTDAATIVAGAGSAVAGATVIAAGHSTRLGTRWPGLPKPMIPIHDEPIVGRIVRWLSRAGIGPITVVWGPPPGGTAAPVDRDGQLVPRYFGSDRWQGGTVTLIPGRAEGSAIDAILGIRATEADLVLVVACDIVVDLPLPQFLNGFRSTPATAGVALTRRPDADRSAEYAVDRMNRVVARRGRGRHMWGPQEPVDSWWGAAIGVGVIRRDEVMAMPEPEPGTGFGAAVYDRIARAGAMYAYDNQERFVADIGTYSFLAASPTGIVLPTAFAHWPD